MSMLNDLKRLLFGAKSVVKSTADKAVEAGKEAGGELVDKSGEILDKALNKMEELGGEVMDKVGPAFETAKGAVDEIVDDIWKAAEKRPTETPGAMSATPPPTSKFGEEGEPILEADPTSSTPPSVEEPDLKGKVEQIGAKVMETAEELGSKVMEKANEVSGKIFDSSGDVSEQIMHKVEDIGGKVMEAGGDLWEKAKNFGGSVVDKANEMVEKANEAAAKEGNLDDTLKKAQEMGDEIEQKAKGAGGFVHDPINTKDSLLENKDSFFEKARRFAEGDYDGTGGPKVTKSTEPTPPAPPKEGKTKGFDDLDGDGNDIVDDAIVEDQ